MRKDGFWGGGTQNKLLVLVQSDKHQLDGRNRDYTVACVCVYVLLYWLFGARARSQCVKKGGVAVVLVGDGQKGLDEGATKWRRTTLLT